ncbi:MarR family transcriptional regulator (plasmid) [Kovacikia minuta CCNUW1]|uniref:MarR family winged helix-turn-helix transcriptional regulator n=1 Tax=Kovacikia minuta TaxID=2931930 RepID=UPI001CC945D8|nr:MarR family transcriptional regulator [Kovacikia minuta]UBF30041.1 MarR family transcriptional regulator [Kovacikia minuta CCNUW1]
MPSIHSTPRLQSWQEVKAPQSLGYRIKLLSQLLGRRFQDQLEPYGLTTFHWVVLCCLWEQDGLSTSALGEQLRQVGGTLTGVIDRMEERGLVRRERDSSDRRVWRIWLTDTGRQLEDVLPDLALELRKQVLQGFTEAEQRLFSDWVDRAILNLTE